MLDSLSEVTFREILKSILTYNDQELIAALKAKDDEAYLFLYDTYSAALYSIIKQMAGDAPTANDLLQEVFISSRQKIESYDPIKEKLFMWLIIMARDSLAENKRTKYANRSTEIPTANVLQKIIFSGQI